MAQELLDFRRKQTEASSVSDSLKSERDELSMENLQIKQENRLLHQQLMEMQEKKMRPQQMMTAYSGNSSGTHGKMGKRAVPGNVNITKPMNQQ